MCSPLRACCFHFLLIPNSNNLPKLPTVTQNQVNVFSTVYKRASPGLIPYLTLLRAGCLTKMLKRSLLYLITLDFCLLFSLQNQQFYFFLKLITGKTIHTEGPFLVMILIKKKDYIFFLITRILIQKKNTNFSWLHTNQGLWY